jgi:hypothetical protein
MVWRQVGGVGADAWRQGAGPGEGGGTSRAPKNSSSPGCSSGCPPKCALSPAHSSSCQRLGPWLRCTRATTAAGGVGSEGVRAAGASCCFSAVGWRCTWAGVSMALAATTGCGSSDPTLSLRLRFSVGGLAGSAVPWAGSSRGWHSSLPLGVLISDRNSPAASAGSAVRPKGFSTGRRSRRRFDAGRYMILVQRCATTCASGAQTCHMAVVLAARFPAAPPSQLVRPSCQLEAWHSSALHNVALVASAHPRRPES